jgi:hypothetical protein
VIILTSSDPVFGRSLNGMLPLLTSEADAVMKLLKLRLCHLRNIS